MYVERFTAPQNTTGKLHIQRDLLNKLATHKEAMKKGKMELFDARQHIEQLQSK